MEKNMKESGYMFDEMIDSIRGGGKVLTLEEVRALNPLVLAYIGDAVYEVFIRTTLVAMEPNKTAHQLHVMSIEYVKAHAQSDIIHKISDFLTEEEIWIVKRGRNTKSGTVPKNADVVEYRVATGFEALIGYLYLIGNIKRLREVLEASIMDDSAGQQ